MMSMEKMDQVRAGELSGNNKANSSSSQPLDRLSS